MWWKDLTNTLVSWSVKPGQSCNEVKKTRSPHHVTAVDWFWQVLAEGDKSEKTGILLECRC